MHPVRADMTQLPIVGTFDLVLGMKVMQEFSQEEQVELISAIKKLTKNGGVNIVSSFRIAPNKEVAAQLELFVQCYADWEIIVSGTNAGARNGRIVYLIARNE